MYPLFFILLVVTNYPDRLIPFFWVLLVFHVLAWPYIALAIASRARNQKLAEYRNLLLDSAVIGCYVSMSSFNLGPSAAVLLGIHSGCISVGGWRMGVLGALSIGFGMLAGALMFGLHFDPLGGHLVAQGMGVAMIFIYTIVFSWQSHGQAQRVVRVAKQLEAQSVDLQRNSTLLEERTHQLELARDAAEAANSSKSQFLANMSHELRTPLNAIIGYSELLIEEAEELEAQDVSCRTSSKIRACRQAPARLINDVLDLSKIEAGKMEMSLETFDGRATRVGRRGDRPAARREERQRLRAVDPDDVGDDARRSHTRAADPAQPARQREQVHRRRDRSRSRSRARTRRSASGSCSPCATPASA